jgi:signal transduction histidine kinase
VNESVDEFDKRVLILAPQGKDAVLAADVLRRDRLCARACEDLVELCREWKRGAGALLMAEEALQIRELPLLADSLARQPAWSDVPIIVLTRIRDHQENLGLLQAFAPTSNVTLLERPLSALTLVTTLQTALRMRQRQYQVRDLIEQQKAVTEALRVSQEEVLKLNAELERRVAQRTSELRSANSELEAFCYSVSHDLRAPLRAIDGFALSVLEHCDGTLDDEARDYLERARAAARRMQQLINDLLSLSRLSRAQMCLERVDLTNIAQSVARELQQREPERAEVEFKIAPNLRVQGDAALLRIALENLLGNAWKFTCKRSFAVIEFFEQPGEFGPVFVVRDNGAGFDMAYASKLFAPFQRLHTSHDFPGSGIGLATVQRIIRRHDGEVWAEGVPGKGASVYFSLPKAREQKEAAADSNPVALPNRAPILAE